VVAMGVHLLEKQNGLPRRAFFHFGIVPNP